MKHKITWKAKEGMDWVYLNNVCLIGLDHDAAKKLMLKLKHALDPTEEAEVVRTEHLVAPELVASIDAEIDSLLDQLSYARSVQQINSLREQINLKRACLNREPLVW